jgi:hypothetical protein
MIVDPLEKLCGELEPNWSCSAQECKSWKQMRQNQILKRRTDWAGRHSAVLNPMTKVRIEVPMYGPLRAFGKMRCFAEKHIT